MLSNNVFCVIGGDLRQLYCAQAIANDGYTVCASCFEECSVKFSFEEPDVRKAIRKSDTIILPLPVTKDGITLNTPFGKGSIILDDTFARVCSGKKVFCGMKERLLSTSPLWNTSLVFDYSKREEFAVMNAVPTSEGAIECAMREFAGTINGSRSLVAGYGRIGRVLSSMLKGIGADVSVSARKKSDMAFIRAAGMTPLNIEELSCLPQSLAQFDLIFNTVPFMIFDSHTLARIVPASANTIIIDLASLPGGVDFEACERLGIHAMRALSLPGRVAPKTAGEIIKNAVYNITEEDLR